MKRFIIRTFEGFWVFEMPRMVFGGMEEEEGGFEGVWVVEGLFSAALRPSTQPITASMECSGTGLSGEDGCGRHDMAEWGQGWGYAIPMVHPKCCKHLVLTYFLVCGLKK